MYTLRDRDSGALIGNVSDDQRQFLEECLEWDGAEQEEFYLSAELVDQLEEDGAGSYLLRMLRDALDDREGMFVEWAGR